MRIPDREELLDYMENVSGQDSEVQKRILHMLASSQVLRESMAEIKRDLYLVGSQIPDYTPDATFGAEIMRLTQAWLNSVYARKFSLKTFHRSREFFGFILALVGVVMLVLGILGFRLLGR